MKRPVKIKFCNYENKTMKIKSTVINQAKLLLIDLLHISWLALHKFNVKPFWIILFAVNKTKCGYIFLSNNNANILMHDQKGGFGYP